MTRLLRRLLGLWHPEEEARLRARQLFLPERLDHDIAIAKANRAINEMRRLERLARGGSHT